MPVLEVNVTYIKSVITVCLIRNRGMSFIKATD